MTRAPNDWRSEAVAGFVLAMMREAIASDPAEPLVIGGPRGYYAAPGRVTLGPLRETAAEAHADARALLFDAPPVHAAHFPLWAICAFGSEP